MKTSASVAALLCLIPHVTAFELPFQIPFFKAKTAILNKVTDDAPLSSRVAIIGAGAGGSSAAFWISKAKERFGLNIEVDVYEKEDYIGGRSTVVYPYDNPEFQELELGASIFVKINKNLWRATEEFNLTRRDFGDDSTLGIWDGEKFLFTFNGGWWDTLKMAWRYGINSPRRTDSAVADMQKSYLQVYDIHGPKWDNITDLSAKLGFEHLTTSTTSEWLLSKGVSSQYIYELVESLTRVNYAQDADQIHALEGACSLSANQAAGVAGGNYKIFEQFLNRSSANVYLKTPVTSIAPASSNSRQWTIKSPRGSLNYKAVILAAPFHGSLIQVPQSVADQIPPQPYVHLHVTLLTTTSPSPNATFFGLPEGTVVPQAILTSRITARQGGKEPEFNSLTYHGAVREGEWAVKIFSNEPISDDWLKQAFSGNVGWVHRKEWKSYPKLPPTASFPPVKLDQGFYYVNSFEPFISTMETETISSRNVVDLLLNEEFHSGICGSRISSDDTTSRKADTDAVLGWDC